MKSQFVALAIVLAALPALAWGQAPCGCNSRGTVRQTSLGAWSDYHYAGNAGCGCAAPSCAAPSCAAPSCGSRVPSCSSSCETTCCRPCCGRQILCIIPNTVKKIGCVLDCLVPRGPICCNSGCGQVGCTSGCPSCSSGVSDPFVDDMPTPPMPKPTHESRRQPTIRAPREIASAHSAQPAVKNTAQPAVKNTAQTAANNTEAGAVP